MNYQGAHGGALTIPAAFDAGADRSPAMTEVVLGYRAWLVEPGRTGYRLRGLVVPAPWAAMPGVWTVARCEHQSLSGSATVHHDQRSVPHTDCTCGLYLYRSLAVGGYDDRYSQMSGDDLGIVWGAVTGAGRVLAYRHGWRAQYARPVAIVDGSGSAQNVRGLADQLGIPVLPSHRIAPLLSALFREAAAVRVGAA